ncbi:hypothetical protein ACA910_009748 [Epithemia clementina (nom. ined.)]
MEGNGVGTIDVIVDNALTHFQPLSRCRAEDNDEEDDELPLDVPPRRPRRETFPNIKRSENKKRTSPPQYSSHLNRSRWECSSPSSPKVSGYHKKSTAVKGDTAPVMKSRPQEKGETPAGYSLRECQQLDLQHLHHLHQQARPPTSSSSSIPYTSTPTLASLVRDPALLKTIKFPSESEISFADYEAVENLLDRALTASAQLLFQTRRMESTTLQALEQPIDT